MLDQIAVDRNAADPGSGQEIGGAAPHDTAADDQDVGLEC